MPRRSLFFAIMAFSVVARLAYAAPMGFSDAYRTVLDRSLRIQTQRLEIEASEFRKARQWGAFAPNLDLAYTETQTGDTSRTNLRGAGAEASVNLFRSFGDVSGIRAAQQNLVVQREKLLSERQGAEFDALEVLITMVARARQRAINERTVSLRADSLRIAKERYGRGLLALQETEKVAIDLDIARAALADVLTQEAEARAKLIAALGSESIHSEWPWRTEITSAAMESGEFKIEQRPDWRAATAAVGEERFKKRQALGTLLPSLDFTASYGTYDLGQSDRRDWKVLWTFTVPLFNGFRDYSSYRISGVNEQLAQVRLELLQRTAPAEVESLRKSFSEARQTAIAREKTAKTTEKLYVDNLQRFRLGRVNANELAQDLDRLLRSQLQEVDGWVSAHLSFARLCHGLGRYVSASGRCEPSPK